MSGKSREDTSTPLICVCVCENTQPLALEAVNSTSTYKQAPGIQHMLIVKRTRVLLQTVTKSCCETMPVEF